jgi:hypothetical protein
MIRALGRFAIGVSAWVSACTLLRAGDTLPPLGFVPNAGQASGEVAFEAKTRAATIFVTRRGELVYSLRGRDGAWNLSETFVGGRPMPSGGDRAPTRVSYFLDADPARWREALPVYASVRFPEVWERIDVSLRLSGDSVEKLFTIAPRGSPGAIRIALRGAQDLTIAGDGSLVAPTGLGAVAFSPPAAYQERDGKRFTVSVSYALFGRTYGFRLGPYDPALPLVIDPILQSTYLGGGAFEGYAAIAVQPSSGEIYVAGSTQSANFPGVAGGAQPVLAGSNDVYVARLDPSLTRLIQATFFGGVGLDNPRGIALHPADGAVYVAGYSESPGLPGTAGASQPAPAGLTDAFVARLSPSLTTLDRSTFLGGSFTDRAFAVRVHPLTGEVYVAGDSISVDFPGRAGGAQANNNGSSDAFVTRLDASLATVLQSTYLGGGSADQAEDLAFTVGGSEVFVTGITSGGLPGTSGGAQPLFGGASGDTDAFVARFTASLTGLAQATYLGAAAFDNGYALAVDPATGDLYAAGSTASPDFPGVSGGARPVHGGGVADAFISRLSPTLTTLRQSTFFGGSGGLENAVGIGVHPSGPIYATGITDSPDLPGTAGGAQPVFGGFADAYVARFDPTLRVLHQATYLGGTGIDFTDDLALPAHGEIYVTGTTESSDFPRTSGGAQPIFASPPASGIPDAFASRLSPGLEGGPVSPIPTLSAGAMAILAALLAVGALGVLRLRG